MMPLNQPLLRSLQMNEVKKLNEALWMMALMDILHHSPPTEGDPLRRPSFEAAASKTWVLRAAAMHEYFSAWRSPRSTVDHQ